MTGLPRQRHGITPQMVGRYPDYDVLDNAEHWDETTRAAVLARLDDVPPIRFFTPAQADTAGALCDELTAQDAEPRIPVLQFVDQKLHENQGEGYQYFDMPDQRDAWRLVLRGLDEEAGRRTGVGTFAAAPAEVRHAIVQAFSEGELHGGAWNELNVKHAFSVVMNAVLSSFYSHPWAWNEMGFGGPAYPRGYLNLGINAREKWEVPDHGEGSEQ